MATTASNKDAAKVAKLREMAKDKSLPQDVRNTYLDQAVKLEEKAAKDAGVKLAKGGMPVRGERTATNKAKKMMYGGMAEKTKMAVGGMLPPPPMPRKGGTPPAPTSKPSMKDQIAKAGSVLKAQTPATKAMKVVNRQPDAPLSKFTAVSRKMAKGGAVKKAKK